jgi:hypothetical protein
MPSKPRLDVAHIRALAKSRVAESSLRAVADEIGMSKSGLDAFTQGRDPYSKTRIKLAAWFMRQSRPGGGSLPREEVDAAIAVLEWYISAPANNAVRERRIREVASRLFSGEEKRRPGKAR